jgi:hypothetical protein
MKKIGSFLERCHEKQIMFSIGINTDSTCFVQIKYGEKFTCQIQNLLGIRLKECWKLLDSAPLFFDGI